MTIIKKVLTQNKIHIDEKLLLEIGDFAASLGIEIYVVGGYVRDFFLKRQRPDFDCTVVGNAIDFAKKLAEKYNTKAVIYERFGTALVPIGDKHFEFVGTRKEEYEGTSRKPTITQGTLEDDIKRRDFTVNTLAASIMPHNIGEVIDLFSGLADIECKILKTPLDPETTFSDDPLRMMRAARFASQLNFTIEQNALDAITKMADRIKIISQERISDEFLKIMASPQPSVGLYILKETGLLKIIFPEVDLLGGIEIKQEGTKAFGHKDVFRHTLKVVDNIAPNTDNVWLRFAALMHDIAKPQTKRYIDGTGWSFHGHEELGARMQKNIFRRMKFPMEHLPYLEKLVRLHQRPMMLVDDIVTDSAIRRLAAQAGDALQDLFTLCRADITTKNPNRESKFMHNYDVVFQKVIDVQEKDKLREFQSPVRGEEIMEICQIPPSKLVGVLKSNIEEAILDGIIANEYEEAKKYFLENKDSWIAEYKLTLK